MKRRRLLGQLAAIGCAALVPGCASSRAGAPRRVGYLSGQAQEVHDAFIRSFMNPLADLGHIEGRDLEMYYQIADGHPERLPAMVASLLAVPVDVIVADGGRAQLAAKAATSTVPIVVLVGPDPVQYGLVASVAHPGGNVTGVSIDPLPQNAKKLQLLKETVPAIRRVAVIYRADNTSEDSANAALEAAPSLGLEAEKFGASNITELHRQLERVATGHFDGIMTTSLLSVVRQDVEHIPAFAESLRLPQIFGDISIARRGGGLMHYGFDFELVHHEAALLVHKILNGAHPADLPVALPTKVDFVINRAAARRLGITFPDTIVRQATEEIP